MDTRNPVLLGLICKRAELAWELEAIQSRIAGLVAGLNNLDATIRLFSPDLALEEVAPTHPRPRHAATPGQISRVLTQVVREASQPLTTHDLTLRVTVARQLDAQDRALFLTMQKRVLASLSRIRTGRSSRRILKRDLRRTGTNPTARDRTNSFA